MANNLNKVRFSLDIDLETGKYAVELENKKNTNFDRVRGLIEQVLDDLEVKMSNTKSEDVSEQSIH